jgi:hypothetical protein
MMLFLLACAEPADSNVQIIRLSGTVADNETSLVLELSNPDDHWLEVDLNGLSATSDGDLWSTSVPRALRDGDHVRVEVRDAVGVALQPWWAVEIHEPPTLEFIIDSTILIPDDGSVNAELLLRTSPDHRGSTVMLNAGDHGTTLGETSRIVDDRGEVVIGLTAKAAGHGTLTATLGSAVAAAPFEVAAAPSWEGPAVLGPDGLEARVTSPRLHLCEAWTEQALPLEVVGTTDLGSESLLDGPVIYTTPQVVVDVSVTWTADKVPGALHVACVDVWGQTVEKRLVAE